MTSGIDARPWVPWTLAHRHQQSDLIVQYSLERTRDFPRDPVRSTTVSLLFSTIAQVTSWHAGVRKLRFRKPEPLLSYIGRILATQPGFSCPQIPPKLVPPEGLSEGALKYTKTIKVAYPDSEDCDSFCGRGCKTFLTSFSRSESGYRSTSGYNPGLKVTCGCGMPQFPIALLKNSTDMCGLTSGSLEVGLFPFGVPS